MAFGQNVQVQYNFCGIFSFYKKIWFQSHNFGTRNAKKPTKDSKAGLHNWQ